MAQKVQPQRQSLYGSPGPLSNQSPAPILANRAPTTSDTGYQLGQIWNYKAGNSAYILNAVSAGSATWNEITNSGGGTGVFSSLSAPTAATNVTEWANLTTGTLSIGGTAQTGTITLGNSSGTQEVDIAVGAGAATVKIAPAVSSGATVEIGKGGLGTTTVNIATGATPNIVTIGSTNGVAATTIQAGSGNINLTGAVISSGVISAGTGLTATLGNITATNGNLSLNTAGNKLIVNAATPGTSSVGTSGAMTAGTVTVPNTSVTAASKIFCYPAALGTVTVPSAYYISAISAGVSFTITASQATDTSTWNYWIIN